MNKTGVRRYTSWRWVLRKRQILRQMSKISLFYCELGFNMAVKFVKDNFCFYKKDRHFGDHRP